MHFLGLCTSAVAGFSLCRTGLEAIMETYAFWRPPVRTLTFEDFTTMQKQQGKALGPGLCSGREPGRVREPNGMQCVWQQAWPPMSLEQTELSSSVNN